MNTARTFVRSLTAGEQQALEKGRKSSDPFTVRRSLVLVASADGLGPAVIGRLIRCTAQAVRDAIRAFEADGLACRTAKSHARKDPGRVWDRDRDEDLKVRHITPAPKPSPERGRRPRFFLRYGRGNQQRPRRMTGRRTRVGAERRAARSDCGGSAAGVRLRPHRPSGEPKSDGG